MQIIASHRFYENYDKYLCTNVSLFLPKYLHFWWNFYKNFNASKLTQILYKSVILCIQVRFSIFTTQYTFACKSEQFFAGKRIVFTLCVYENKAALKLIVII